MDSCYYKNNLYDLLYSEINWNFIYCIITNREGEISFACRAFLAVFAGAKMVGFSSQDVLYSPMPLYHLASGILGAAQSLINGTSVVLRRKFSASNYWKDCVKYNATVRIVNGIILGARSGW